MSANEKIWQTFYSHSERLSEHHEQLVKLTQEYRRLFEENVQLKAALSKILQQFEMDIDSNNKEKKYRVI